MRQWARWTRWVIGILAGAAALGSAAQSPYAGWANGPSTAEDYFPIAVWLQAPRNAGRYQAIGVNLYVGLWSGPTAAQLAELEKAGMPVICHPAPAFKDRKVIVGWMHGDEPDNAQPLGDGKGYGPPVAPEKIIADYEKIKAADPTRPVLLNLGQGVAYDNYIGRGVRRGRMEDYAQYVRGSDVVSFDIYPAVHDRPEIAGNLWYVPRGVTRLREWSADRKVVWNCIETTHVGNEAVKPTPRQVRAEVWLSILHGSRGLIYFAHEFKPKFVEAGLLADAEMSRAVGAINAEVKSLAAAINAPPEAGLASVTSANEKVPVALMARRRGGSVYVFAAATRDGQTTATFALPGVKAGRVEVIGENRAMDVSDGTFADDFKGYDVHLYRIAL